MKNYSNSLWALFSSFSPAARMLQAQCRLLFDVHEHHSVLSLIIKIPPNSHHVHQPSPWILTILIDHSHWPLTWSLVDQHQPLSTMINQWITYSPDFFVVTRPSDILFPWKITMKKHNILIYSPWYIYIYTHIYHIYDDDWSIYPVPLV